MNKSDIYLGTIKRCLDLKKYKQYGEEYIYPEMKVGSMSIGILMPTVSIYDERAILIKTSKGYLPLNDVYGLFAEARIENSEWTLDTKPEKDKDLYVDEKTIVPYYKENLNEKIKIKKLKREALYL